LVLELLRHNPKKIILLDQAETPLYDLENQLRQIESKTQLEFVIGDICSLERMQKLFETFFPQIIFHAAAYKHVPMMENNPSEAIQTNILGTKHLVDLACLHNVQKFIFISTDKAVNPTNVMGASKHLAEIICRGLQLKSKTDFVITRFGNVLGSSGSVIPKFREQISLGGPITVTHPEMTRYFMSIPEAAQLVIQASLMGKDSQIFVLDMGEPVKINDLAKDMIKLSGFDEGDIKIEYTGLRPGEKLYEELLSDSEIIMPTNHPKLKIAYSKRVSGKLVKDLIKWIVGSTSKTELQIKKELKGWVKGYPAIDTKKS
jgi:FlaA1/EpsC-like NDP-sugar epimerase